MSDTVELLIKGVRALPQEEQDALLVALLREHVTVGQRPQAVPIAGGPPEVVRTLFGAGLLPGQESGGPWHTVPVRLSAEQHEGLKQWCQANNFTMAVVLRGLVARFLDAERARPPRQPRDAEA
jgi:hypothetical protein